MNQEKFDEQFERARDAGIEANRLEPRAIAARYDSERKEIVVELKEAGMFKFAACRVPAFRGAADDDLEQIEVSPSGEGLHWEKLNEDLSLPELIKGNYGPEPAPDVTVDKLYIDLEMEWSVTRDPRIVDRISATYPMFSAELYDFFALLVESDATSGTEAEVAALGLRKYDRRVTRGRS